MNYDHILFIYIYKKIISDFFVYVEHIEQSVYTFKVIKFLSKYEN